MLNTKDRDKHAHPHFSSYYRWLVINHLFNAEFKVYGKTLDVGCGNGFILSQIRSDYKVGADHHLFDQASHKGNLYVQTDALRLPFKEGSFDLVLAIDIIEHVEEDFILLDSITKVIAREGTLWLGTPSSSFTLFPRKLTSIAENSWGHIRSGYEKEELIDLIPIDGEFQIIYWNEPIFRHAYFILRILNSISPFLSRVLAHLCFIIDKHFAFGKSGHIFLQVEL